VDANVGKPKWPSGETIRKRLQDIGASSCASRAARRRTARRAQARAAGPGKGFEFVDETKGGVCAEGIHSRGAQGVEDS